jgi:MFS family permease
MFNAWGIVFSFGVFQTFYTSPSGIKDNKSPSAIAWIGSVQNFLLLFGGALSGICFDKGYFRYMILLGSFFVVVGMMALSLATRYYQVLLSQGFCVGLGMGLLLVPSVGLPSTWFVKHRGIAVGLVSSGASIAGIVFPIAARSLIARLNFQWAARTLGFISLVTLSISITLAQQRLPPRGRGSFVEYRALKQPEFALYVFGLFISMFGFYTFYTFVEVWAVSSDITGDGKLQAVYVLPILNAASLVGRIGPSYCSDLLGPLNIQAPAMLLCGVLVLIWMKIQTAVPFILVVVLYGISSGAVIAMPPVVIASMTEDMTTFGGRMGVFFLAISCSSLAGPPINGAIIQAQNMTYDGTRIFSGIIIIIGAGFLGAARMAKSKLKFYVKV